MAVLRQTITVGDIEDIVFTRATGTGETLGGSYKDADGLDIGYKVAAGKVEWVKGNVYGVGKAQFVGRFRAHMAKVMIDENGGKPCGAMEKAPS